MSISNVSGSNPYAWLTSQTSKTGQNMPVTSNGSTLDTNSASATPDPRQAFLDYMNLSPAEKMQQTWLAQHGISKDEFDAMPDDEKQKIIMQMKQDIEEKIREQQRTADHKPVDMVV